MLLRKTLEKRWVPAPLILLRKLTVPILHLWTRLANKVNSYVGRPFRAHRWFFEGLSTKWYFSTPECHISNVGLTTICFPDMREATERPGKEKRSNVGLKHICIKSEYVHVFSEEAMCSHQFSWKFLVEQLNSLSSKKWQAFLIMFHFYFYKGMKFDQSVKNSERSKVMQIL